MAFPLISAVLRRDSAAAPADWERPAPGAAGYRNDVWLAAAWWVLAVLVWFFVDQLSDEDSRIPAWKALLGFLFLLVPLAFRRRFPLLALLVASAAFLLLGLWVPQLGNHLAYQAAYFATLYSAAAWERDTRAFWVCTAVVIGVMLTWVIGSVTLASSVQHLLKTLPEQHGLLPPLLAMALYALSLNIAFFGAALTFGRRARAGAWQREQLQLQAHQLQIQADELARRAVVDERLRIARELHDVVAHHISAVGVQAAAARRTQERSPETAARLMGQIEESSRRALAETRALLGVLRTDTSAGSGPDARGERSPEPGLADLEGLIERAGETGVRATLRRVEDPALALADVPNSLGLSLYRVVQEALSNIRRHSSATTAEVTVRTGVDAAPRPGRAAAGGADAADAGASRSLGAGRNAGAPGAAATPTAPATPALWWVEAEIIDHGRPLPGTSGSGLGQRGMRERALLHGGLAEIGPRTTGGAGSGYRVRVRLPLERPLDAASSPTASNPSQEPQHD